MPPRIFIGGTGRSGTSIVYRALGCNHAIHSFPREMRFLVDPGGLVDLVDVLTVEYSPTQAREKLYEFERLMRVYLTVPERAPYRGYDLPHWLGRDYYWEQLDRFCTDMVEIEYCGIAWQVEPDHEGRLVEWAKRLQAIRQQLQGEPVVPFRLTLPRDKLRMAKYFADRSQLVARTASFVDDLFLHAAEQHGKQTWCEKTPQNMFHIDFLWELFPESVFIHIKRDPRGVVHSMTKDSWGRAPEDIEKVCRVLKTMYDRWFGIKQTLDCERRYLELKIEDIAAAPQSTLTDIASFCGVEPRFDSLPDISEERVNYWRSTMPADEQHRVNELLGNYIERLGYPSDTRR